MIIDKGGGYAVFRFASYEKIIANNFLNSSGLQIKPLCPKEGRKKELFPLRVKKYFHKDEAE